MISGKPILYKRVLRILLSHIEEFLQYVPCLKALAATHGVTKQRNRKKKAENEDYIKKSAGYSSNMKTYYKK